jgi:hypothetical protein
MGKRRSKVVRAERVEVVDSDGRVRLVLGLLGRGDDEVWGVAVRNAAGRDRVWMVAEGTTAEVGLDFGGNTVAALAVGEDGRVAFARPTGQATAESVITASR